MDMNNDTGKGKTLLVPIIAVALFLMLVFGATYAYFNATTTITNVANVKATIPQAGTTLTTNASPCVITVDAANMTEQKKGTEVGSSTCWVEVTYTAATGVVCTYDVKVTETSSTAYSISATGITEFTGVITSVSGTGAENDLSEATQMDTVKGMTRVAHATATGTGTAFTQRFNFEEKFYNANAPQGKHAGKTYTYNLAVTNVQC